jgi:hypothetical protein
LPTTAHDSSNPTLHDLVLAQDPNGSQAKIVEALKKRLPALDYITFVQGNLETGHRVTTETALPSIGYRAFNEGVETGKYTTGQFDEVCGLMEGHSQLDVKLAELNGNSAAYRASVDMRFLRAFKQEFETGFFYNSTAASKKKFNGLAPRYAALSGTPYAEQVVDSSVADGTGNDQTSMYLVCFSPDTVFGITPKGAPSGLTMEDMGIQMVTDAANNRFRAYETVWNWSVGVCVADAESVVRIANIDTGSIVKTGQLLIDDMTTAYFRLRDPSAGRCVWFGNRTINEYLFNQARGMVSSATLSIKEDLVSGRPLTHFMGIPFVVTDSLLNTEAPVS